MIIKRRIRKVGNSLMISLPPETLQESGFREGMEIAITSSSGRVEMEPAEAPRAGVAEFTMRFTDRYREALARLAE